MEAQEPVKQDPNGFITFVCISDTHGKTSNLTLPPGDILLHCGDFTYRGYPEEVEAFNEFILKQNFRYKIVIAGNHDTIFDLDNYDKFLAKKFHAEKGKFPYPEPINAMETKKKLNSCIYLEDSYCEIFGYKIYGSPWTPTYHNWGFNLDRGHDIMEKWSKIPSDIDILMTHGPPFGILDKCDNGTVVGCEKLLSEIKYRIKPKVHVFGHIHECHGVLEDAGTAFINASICTRGMNPENPPIVFKLPVKK